MCDVSRSNLGIKVTVAEEGDGAAWLAAAVVEHPVLCGLVQVVGPARSHVTQVDYKCT